MKRTHKYILVDPLTYQCAHCKHELSKLGNGTQRKLSELNKEYCLEKRIR